MMKSRFLMTLTLTLLVSCASFLTGCTKDNIVPPEEESEEVVKTAREVLSEIKGVTIIDDDKDVDGNDPWTGAAIPDPDKDDPYVKKYVVPNGTHNAWLTYPSYYTAQDRDYIVNTVKEWLK